MDLEDPNRDAHENLFALAVLQELNGHFVLTSEKRPKERRLNQVEHELELCLRRLLEVEAERVLEQVLPDSIHRFTSDRQCGSKHDVQRVVR